MTASKVLRYGLRAKTRYIQTRAVHVAARVAITFCHAVFVVLTAEHCTLAAPPNTFFESARGRIPASSTSARGDAGVRMHTNYILRKLVAPRMRPSLFDKAANGIPDGVSLTTLRAIYKIPANGGANAIAIVDAFDYPTALSDFNHYATAARIPVEPSTDATNLQNNVLQVVYAGSTKPNADAGWNGEAALA